jgi:hypothetical protein
MPLIFLNQPLTAAFFGDPYRPTSRWSPSSSRRDLTSKTEAQRKYLLLHHRKPRREHSLPLSIPRVLGE